MPPQQPVRRSPRRAPAPPPNNPQNNPPNNPPNNDPDGPDPASDQQQYIPLDVDPSYRRGRVIDLAGHDVLLAARSLARMRVFDKPPGSHQWRESLAPAPMDWHESYSNIKVESWVYMWVQAFCRGRESWIKPPVYQHHLPGSYLIGDKNAYRKEGQRSVDGGAFVDFAWLPPDENSIQRTVLLEVDENAHYKAGWDAERYREVFVLEEVLKQYRVTRKHRSILLIRLNPHEYKDKEEVHHGNEPNVYTTEPSRDIRMGNVGELIKWGMGRPGSNQQPGPIQNGITVAFAYYDKWYEDDPNSPQAPIHLHHYKNLRAFKAEARRASGPRIPLSQRKMFLRPVWWDHPGNPRGSESTNVLNPFSTLPANVRGSMVGMLQNQNPNPQPNPIHQPQPAVPNPQPQPQPAVPNPQPQPALPPRARRRPDRFRPG